MGLRQPPSVSRSFIALLVASGVVFGVIGGILYGIGVDTDRTARITSIQHKHEHTELLARLRAEASGKGTATNENTPVPSVNEEALGKPGGSAPSKTPTAATSSLPDTKNCNDGGPHTDTADLLAIIVNKKHCLKPIDFVPSLQTVACAGGNSATISTLAVSSFTQLCTAAKNAGVPLGITSSYRSYQTQVSTYGYWVSTSGQAGADRYSARPGYSEHQTGLSIDFSAGSGSLDGFTGTPQQKWMATNAWKYGFIQRYTTANSALTGYNAESWHYRYVGTAVATQIRNLGSSASLESLWGVSGGDYK